MSDETKLISGLRDYILYIKIHLLLAFHEIIEITDNEYFFYKDLETDINFFLENTKFFKEFITTNKTLNFLKSKYDIHQKHRDFINLILSQAENLKNFIIKNEKVLSIKYNYYGE